MQADDVEFVFTPSILETPSLLTPNIVANGSTIHSIFNSTNASMPKCHENGLVSETSSIGTTSSTDVERLSESETPSTDAKLSTIKDELKQSFSEKRLPTPSPFQNMSKAAFVLNKPSDTINDDPETIEIPSTADVVSTLEALSSGNATQTSIKSIKNNTNNEREIMTMNGDNVQFDSSQTITKGGIVSPKKKLLMRSQSHTEPTPICQDNNNDNNNNLSYSQNFNHDNNLLNNQNDYEEENLNDDSVQKHIAIMPDVPLLIVSNGVTIGTNQLFKDIVDDGTDQHINIQSRPGQINMTHTTIKQNTLTNNSNTNKRPYQATAAINNHASNISHSTKANTTTIPQTSINEVSSTDQVTSGKRLRQSQQQANSTTSTFRATYSGSSPPTNVIPSASTAANGLNGPVVTDDQRKKQIRDSNREAARRCRERRRQYIEQLEGNVEQYKQQIKQLNEKVARVERENTQLRAIISETKILYPASRAPTTDGHIEYANVMATVTTDFNSDSNHQNDGATLQRNFRNNH